MGKSTTAKTTEHDGDVDAFIESITDELRRADARTLRSRMEVVTGHPARMWGASIIGFDSYHYEYPSGQAGDMAAIGFSPRKAATTVYFMGGFDVRGALLTKLGPHSTGKSCLHLKRLDAVDLEVLDEIVRRSYADVKER